MKHSPHSRKRSAWCLLATLCMQTLCLPPWSMATTLFPPLLAPESLDDTPRTRPGSRGAADRVVVRKADRRLFLMQGDQVIREYEISLGFKPSGPKRQEGDGRTPEGRYRLRWRNEKSRYYRSIQIDYPGPLDRRRAGFRDRPPGGLIMIHGQPNARRHQAPIEGDWTLGCIAVSNAAMDEIWSLTKSGTPIEILP